MKTKYLSILLKRSRLERAGLLAVAVMLSIIVTARAAPLNRSAANRPDNLAAPRSANLSQSRDSAATGDPTITVNTLDDEFNTDGDCSLPEAITAANTNAAVDACAAGIPGADTITFGVTGTLVVSPPNPSMPTITEDLTLAGPGAANLIITNWSGPDAQFRLFEVDAGVTLRLQQLTITATHGIRNAGTLVVSNSTFSENTSPASDNGGAIEGGTVMIENSTFSGNHLGVRVCGAPAILCGLGGAIYADTVTVTNSTFSGSGDELTGGGAIYSKMITVTNSAFSGNIGGGGGGAIYSQTITVTNSTFSDNIGVGGAIYIEGSGEIHGGIFSNNRTFTDGGAIFNHGALLTVTGSTFSGNRASSALAENGGGAIYNDNATRKITIRDSIFSNNQADNDGGAIDVVENGSEGETSFLIVNSTFSGNQAGSHGGAIANHVNRDFRFESTILNSTFSGNSAAMGSGLFNDGGMNILQNTIIANGLLGNNCDGVIFDYGHNMQTGDPGSCAGIPIADPLLGPLADNGGPTLTHALLPGSPAIDAVPLADCNDNNGDPLGSDQRGVVRPQDGDGDGIALCDIGAFEYEIPLKLFLPLIRR